MGTESKFSYRDGFPERVMIARVYRTDSLGKGPRGRTSFEFDALDATRADPDTLAALYRSDEVAPFGLLRILTTAYRFATVFDTVPREGAWYRLELTPEGAASRKAGKWKLPAWHAQLTPDGYSAQSRGYVTKAEFLTADGDPPLKSLSAALAPATANVQGVIAVAGFPQGAIASASVIKAVIKALPPPRSVHVHDVGQASLTSLLDGLGNPILHFDAGWPASFNGRTAPKAAMAITSAPVILSHWDWDHLGGYYKFPVLRMSPWIAPVQPLGPGAGRIAARLHDAKKLLGLTVGPIATRWGVLGVCRGAFGDKNQTGLAIRARLVGSKLSAHQDPPRWALLTGDADYALAPRALTKAPIHALVVTHHGAEFQGQAPPAAGAHKVAVISVGKGNIYRHPRKPAEDEHVLRGWTLRATSAYRGVKRGFKRLYQNGRPP